MVTIRPYQESDRERLHEITAASFRDASIHGILEGKFGPLRDTTWADRKARDIDDDIAAEPEGVLVAEDDDGAILGYITTVTDEESGIGRIPNLAVAPDTQGQGIGTTLINAALDRFEELGMDLIKIETLATNEVGRKFYPRFGFEDFVHQVHYIMRTEDAKRL
ncbi:MAG: GNAT family N-acetyltransferase [Armatimonadota bacterium]|jgi:ribosomal protein S18 acetylase RimI-like enzyme